MSAFYDIWISNKTPKHKRTGNNAWRKTNNNVWLSLPDNKKFIRETETITHRLVLIGQLYEALTDTRLIEHCLAYINKKSQTYKDPAGHYIIFLIDKRKQHVHIFTNRLGTVHAYYSKEQKGNAVSTNFLSLAKSRKDKTLDWEAITGFMAMGYFPNDTTYLEDVSIFESASYYHFDSGLNLLEQKRYWTWSFNPRDVSLKDNLDILHDILNQSLSVATYGQNVALPISGGLDSRMLAGELEDGMSYNSIKAFSYGFSDSSQETRIATKIAEAQKLDIYSYKMPNYLFNEIDSIVESVELFQYIDGTRQASAKKWLTENSDVVVGGHWGDVWMDNAKIAFSNQLNSAFEKKIIKRGSDWLIDNLCSKHVDKPTDYLNDYFLAFVQKYQYLKDPDFLMKVYKTEQWSFRWTAASLRMYQAGAYPILPFYDKRIVDFFSTIPTKTITKRHFQVEYIKHFYKELASIKWQEYDANLYNYKKFNNRNIAYRAIKKLQRSVKAEKVTQRNWEVFYLNDSGRNSIEGLLVGNKLLDDLIEPSKTKELIEDLYKNPNAANGYTISMLLTFVCFLNEIFE